jgi:uncharacterized protein (TIGR00106 family)
MEMIVQFSVNPMDSEHISEDIGKITAYLDKVGLDYDVGPIGTSIQGEWDTIMPVIQKCHQMIIRDHARVLTTITIDDHKYKEHSLETSVASVTEPVSISL